MALSGSCDFCGQTMVLSEDKYPLIDPEDQAQIDAVVTANCSCPRAKSERRKQDTAEKIEQFITKEMAPEAEHIIRAAVDAVRDFNVESVTITDNDGWKTKISINKGGYLVFDPKKTISKKTEF